MSAPEPTGADRDAAEPGASEASASDPDPARPGEHVSARWARWRAMIDLDDYDARWERMLAAGEAAHGEADLAEWLGRTPLLDAGCGTGRVAIELVRRGHDVVGADLDPDMIAVARRKAPHLTWVVADLAALDLGRRFGVVMMAGNVLLFSRPQDRAAIVANLARHVAADGFLVAGFSLEPGGYRLEEYDAACRAAGLVLHERWATWERAPYADGDYAVSVHRPA
jgi:SAM-dependent methyltransferase